MRQMKTVWAAAGLSVMSSLIAHAQVTLPPGLDASVGIGGNTYDLKAYFHQTAAGYALYDINPSTQQQIPVSITTGDGTVITVSSTGVTDPSLTYSFSATNPTSNTQTFTFNETLPIIPCPIGSKLTTSIAGGITDDTGFGVTVGPVPGQNFLQQATGNGTNLNMDVGPGVMTPPGDPGSFNYGPYSKTGISSFVISALDIHLQFTLTGDNAAASFTGRVACTDTGQQGVPEPGSVALLASLSVAGAGLLVRRRRTNR